MLIVKDRNIVSHWQQNDNTILIAPSNKGYKKDGSNVDDKIIEEYKRNIGVKSISKSFNVSTKYIYKVLKKANVTKNASECKTQYNIIYPDFFKSIESEEQAYYLGLLYADGWLDSKRSQIAISLHENDVDILKKFNSLIFEDKPLYYYKPKGNKGGQYRFTITNKKMYNDSLNLGLMPNKTFKLKFPNFISDEYMRHFIRGYFDGDGCIGNYKRLKKDNKYRYVSTFSVIGTYDLLDGISTYLYNIANINKPIIKVKHKDRPQLVYFLSYSSKKDVLLIRDILYNDANYFLKRKFDKFYSII